MNQPNRLPAGGRIDRGRRLSLSFDGGELSAYQGDTLASAMLAGGGSVVARSFKYHRARGIYAAGVEEPNALVSLRTGARHEPNTVATTVEAYDGLAAFGQNAWPNVRFDFGAVNQLFAPFLAAGFYYKTFVGPDIGPIHGTRFWMMCERLIRRAAGMGRAPAEADPDTYEKVNEHCDCLVIGSGPAGLAAALAAGRCGQRVILAEQDFALGGSLLQSLVGSEADRWLGDAVAELRTMANVRILLRTTVFGAYDSDVYGAVERVQDHVVEPRNHQPRQRFRQIRARRAVLATGAIERPMVFGGNDRPGVMLAGSVRSYLNRHAVLVARAIVVATNNDSAYVVASDLARAGATVTLADVRRDVPAELLQSVTSAGVEVRLGTAVIGVTGSRRVKGAVLAPVDNGGRATEGGSKVPCGVVAVSGGWSPALHLWSQRGAKPVFDSAIAAFVPDATKLPTLVPAGAGKGGGSTAEAIVDGWSAGMEPSDAGVSTGELPPATWPGDDWGRDVSSLWSFTASNGKAPGKAFVDLQHDVTGADIDLAHREGFVSVEHLKRYTTTGMAADQGKLSNLPALARMAVLRGLEIPQVGTTTFRPPYTPISFGSIAALRHGQHLHPLRRTALHDWHVSNGAVMTEAAGWWRPWYYPLAGESVRDAYIREAAHVREHAGIVDVSTLGKIAVQGPDAGAFLDRLYVNRFGTLAIGRLRYGVMLRDDGILFDDGTVARLGECEYLVTTTTAQAGKVLAFMEEVLQTAWQDLRVTVSSITDQWAAAAVAGPKSRALLSSVVRGADLSAEALRSTHFISGTIEDVDVRLHRMSYSGELAYEVYMPWKASAKVWSAIVAAGVAFDLKPYGTEAMGALRIEKGHIAGPEIDGRTTLNDVAMPGLASRKKPFVGSVLRGRPLLVEPSRPTLVGLEVEGDAGAKAGSLLFGMNAPVSGHGEGVVTSTTYSPALSKNIALGLLAHGPDRLGERVQIVDFLSETILHARVVPHHFYDPEGVRQNG